MAYRMTGVFADRMVLRLCTFRSQSVQSSGLDSRYMISRLKPPNVKVLSLTTIASPHRGKCPSSLVHSISLMSWAGSAFADYVFDRLGRE